ncbi:hypothetical protein [Streptomyces sp. HB132]|uniref:hypothetical protein n=1 Tax=Streptomyces sp. HB132 TaxID=767388 RepID=UPI0019618F27|nr:hypothetical protein [Streptomyces sp. HB132]MBM7436680.1 hypothetical protein [Streptomyces sp. HB132]
MNPDTTPVAAGPSDLALPLALATELAASAASAPTSARPPEIRSATGRGRRAARRRAAAVRG